MLNAFIIVWRESLEALLVVGVLLAAIARQPQPARLRRGLWLGVLAGLALATTLGLAIFAVHGQFAGEALDVFQLAMALAAAALLVHTVFWMRRHAPALRDEVEARAARSSGALGIAAISALAVAREGAETVVFLYGLGLEAGGDDLARLLAAALAGLLLAAATSVLIARGARRFTPRTLFRLSEVLLLLIANALLASSVDRMLAMDWLPPLIDPVWDLSTLLDDGGGPGRVLADFVGYRARPAGILVVATLGVWAAVLWRLLPAPGQAIAPIDRILRRKP